MPTVSTISSRLFKGLGSLVGGMALPTIADSTGGADGGNGGYFVSIRGKRGVPVPSVWPVGRGDAKRSANRLPSTLTFICASPAAAFSGRIGSRAIRYV